MNNLSAFQEYDQSKINYKTFSFYFLLFLLGKSIFSLNASSGVFYYLGLFFLLTYFISSLFIPRKWLFIHCLMLIFCHPDITQDNIDMETYGALPSASIWQISLFGEPIIFWTLLLFSIYFIRIRKLNLSGNHLLIFLLFIFMPIITGLFNGYLVDIGRVIVDLKFGIMLLIGIIFFESSSIRSLRNIEYIFYLILAGSLSNFSYDLFSFISSSFLMDNYEFKNLSMDVAKITTLLVFYWSMLMLKFNLKSPIHIFLMIFSLLLIFQYQTRWLILTLIAGLFFLPGRYSLRIIVLIIFSVTLITFLYLTDVLYVVQMINRFNVFDGIDLETIDPNRYFSIINAIEAINERNAWIFGMGAGSYFTDSPFLLSNLTTASYDQASLDTGKYFRLHDIFTHFIFKYGILGCLIYTYFIVSFLKLSKKYYYDENIKIFVYSMMCMLPTILTFPFYTSKGVLLTAFFFCIFRRAKFDPESLPKRLST